YFPPAPKWRRPSFVQLLTQLGQAWRDDRARIVASAATIVDRLREATGSDCAAADRAPVAGRDAIDAGVPPFGQAFDGRHGGFGGAPKFPRPSELLFLLSAYGLTRNFEARRMTLDTLRAMAMGGIHDHVGGGFHRYSVDAEWRVPHFEKMLYDQAQLVLAYLEAAQATGARFFAEGGEDPLAYVMRDMTDPAGGFYSAEDADSVPPEQADRPGAHKMEGAFYIWSDAEIERLLGDDAPIARRRFGIERGGNAPQDPQGEFTGKNLLYEAESIHDIAARTSRSEADGTAALGRIRDKLFAARATRPRPHLDDKALTAWNGLMIAAFARAARVLPESAAAPRYLTAAQR